MDIPLNDEGRKQAVALAERAADLELDIVYSSTLLRAKETAQIVCDRCGQLPHTSLRDLEEMSWGVFEGRSRSPELQTTFRSMVAEWQSGNYGFAVEGGESVLDVQMRSKRALDKILSRHEGQRVFIVAHGRTLRILLATLLKEFGLQRMEEIKHHNTGLNHLVYENSGFEAKYLNDISHLEVANSSSG